MTDARPLILVVEDQQDIRVLLSRYLEGRGYRVACARDGVEGVEQFEAERPALVLLDLMLPRLTGRQVAERMQDLDPHVPLVALSAMHDLATQCAEMCIGRWIPKPFQLGQVRHAIEELLGRKPAPASPAPASPAPVRPARVHVAPVRPAAAHLEADLTPFSCAGRPGLVDVDAAEAEAGLLYPMAGAEGPSGVYGALDFPALLERLSGARFTGRLHLQHGVQRKQIEILNGFPVNASSNVRAEVLGYWLRRRGVISEAQLHESQDLMLRDGLRQGEALVRLGVLTMERLFQLLREMIREKVLNVFAWPGGTYGTAPDPEVGNHTGIFQTNPLLLVFEGVLRHAPAERVVAAFDARMGRSPARSAAFDECAFVLKPYAAELRVAGLCDGRRTVSEVVSASPYGLLDTLRILRALEVTRGLDFDLAAAPAPSASLPDWVEPQGATTREMDPFAVQVLEFYLRTADADHYTRLGVPRDAKPEAVNAAYRGLVARFHPDKVAQIDNEEARARGKELFIRLRRSRDALLNVGVRRAYDAGLAEREAAPLRPRFADADIFDRGRALLQRGRLREAATCFDQAVAADATQGHYRVYRAYVRFHLLDPQHQQTRRRMLDEMRTALFDCQARDDCTVLVARAYASLGQTDVAVKLCRRALALNPDCADATTLLAQVEVRRYAG